METKDFWAQQDWIVYFIQRYANTGVDEWLIDQIAKIAMGTAVVHDGKDWVVSDNWSNSYEDYYARTKNQ